MPAACPVIQQSEPAAHIDAADHESGVDAMVNVGFNDVVLEIETGRGQKISVARSIDNGLGQYCLGQGAQG